jgi:serine/threonine protein kinase
MTDSLDIRVPANLPLLQNDFVDIKEWSRSSSSVIYRATRWNYGVKVGQVAIKEWAKGRNKLCIAEAQWASEISSEASWHCIEIRSLEGQPFKGGLATISPWYGDQTLADVITKGPVPLLEAKKLWRDMTNVLAELFTRGIVHGDIKPENIIAARANWVLIDYGSAGHTGASERVLGTPAYMAPEVFDGNRHPHSDVYSLALTIADAVTGELRDSWGRSRDSSSATKPESVSAPQQESAASGIPRDWTKLISSCLDEPDLRPHPMTLLSLIENLSE